MAFKEFENNEVWIIGDSHVSAFSVDSIMIPEFPDICASPFNNVHVCRLGPQLAGTLAKAKSSTNGRQKAFDLIDKISKNATVFFSFGEIDCRKHIVRRAQFKDELLANSVAETIANYMRFVHDFQDRAKDKNLSIGIISPPQNSVILNPFHDHPILTWLTPISQTSRGLLALRIARNFFPKKSVVRQSIGVLRNYSGTAAQRARASMIFNEMVAEKCAAANLLYIDMFSPFLNSNGTVETHWFWDAIHLKQAAVTAVSNQFESLGIMNFKA